MHGRAVRSDNAVLAFRLRLRDKNVEGYGIWIGRVEEDDDKQEEEEV